jgi:hypothetical protein
MTYRDIRPPLRSQRNTYYIERLAIWKRRVVNWSFADLVALLFCRLLDPLEVCSEGQAALYAARDRPFEKSAF